MRIAFRLVDDRSQQMAKNTCTRLAPAEPQSDKKKIGHGTSRHVLATAWHRDRRHLRHHVTAVQLCQRSRVGDTGALPSPAAQPATVLSGAEERGVNGPSLDRSYFSRLQPISFLFFIAKLAAHIRYSISMLHTHATHARPGKRLKCFDPSTRSRFEVSNAAEEVVFTANVCV